MKRLKMGWITFSYIGGRKNENWMAAASKSQTHREEEEEKIDQRNENAAAS